MADLVGFSILEKREERNRIVSESAWSADDHREKPINSWPSSRQLNCSLFA